MFACLCCTEVVSKDTFLKVQQGVCGLLSDCWVKFLCKTPDYIITIVTSGLKIYELLDKII